MCFRLLLCVRIETDQLQRELLSNISLFVGQLYENKSLALRARDLMGDLRLSGSILRKSRLFFTKERRNISQKSGRFYNSKERFSQVMTRQVIMKEANG